MDLDALDADELRRAARAVRNLIRQVPIGGGEWGCWVPDELERVAAKIESSIGYTYGCTEGDR